MNLDELICNVNAKLQNLKDLATSKRPNLSNEDQLKLDALIAKTESGVRKALLKVKETVTPGEDSEIESFLLNVQNKCYEVCDYTLAKIHELKEVSQSEKIKDAEKDINESFAEFFQSDEFKSAINTVKEVGNQVYQSVNEYMNRPETQEKIKNAKKTTLKFAEKGMDKLREILKTED